jgi:hypothetical protein
VFGSTEVTASITFAKDLFLVSRRDCRFINSSWYNFLIGSSFRNSSVEFFRLTRPTSGLLLRYLLSIAYSSFTFLGDKFGVKSYRFEKLMTDCLNPKFVPNKVFLGFQSKFGSTFSGEYSLESPKLELSESETSNCTFVLSNKDGT